MIYIRRGLSSVSFQGCASGLKSSTQDGSRLSADTTYGSGGLLFEDRDGTKIYFQKVSLVPNKEMCHNNNSCGYARKIVSPNGDWLELNYEVYDSHPSNKPQVEHVAPWLMSTFATTQQCNVVWSGQTDCRYLNTPYYLIRNDGAVSAQGNKAVIDVRLVSTFNSRGYRLLFSYVDPTTTGLPLCTGSPFGGLTCSGSGNESLTRNRLASVTASYQNSSGGITPLGQVSYTYQSRYAGSSAEYLSTITALDGAVTRYDIFGNTFKIWQPGDTVPSSTITFDQGPAGYYYPEVDQNSPYSTPQRTLRYYDRVRTQAFATGELVNYDPTMQGKWIEESYGTFEWRQVTSEMKITVAGTQVTTLKYFDANGEHNRPLSTTNPDGSIVLNSYDASGSLVSSVNPEGNATGYTYDLRGNTVQRTLTPKPGSGLTAISEQWTYVGGPSLVAEACSNQKTCNRPDKYVNPRGDTTDYSWDSATGLIAQKLEPAAPDGLRPTSDFTYASIPASGGTTVLLLASVTAKIDATSSQSTQFEYTAEGRGLLKSKIDTAGSSSLRTCYGYDAPGNKISETAPRAGLSQCQ
jgi:YD repeat-containing protein